MAAVVALLALTVGPRRADAACWIYSTGAIGFSPYNVFNTLPTEGNGTISLLCFPTASVRISLSPGNSNSFAARTMRGPGNLQYQLYTDSAWKKVWGDETGGTFCVYGTVGFTLVVPVYSLIGAQQDVAPGTYSDTIRITVDY